MDVDFLLQTLAKKIYLKNDHKHNALYSVFYRIIKMYIYDPKIMSKTTFMKVEHPNFPVTLLARIM